MAKIKLAKIHAILGRSHRTGRWRLSPKTSVIALLGSCRLDLREAQLDDEVSKMTATVVLGGVTIIVPPGVEVRPSGLSLLGGASVDVPPFDDETTTLIEIEWTSVFGRLRIGAEDELEEVEEAGPAAVDEPAASPTPAAEVASAKPAAAAPESAATPAIGFEDLEPEPEPEPAPAIGFEDLEEPEPEAEPTPNRRADDPEPADEDDDGPQPADEAESESNADEADGDEDEAADGAPADEPTPAAVGFEDL